MYLYISNKHYMCNVYPTNIYFPSVQCPSVQCPSAGHSHQERLHSQRPSTLGRMNCCRVSNLIENTLVLEQELDENEQPVTGMGLQCC